MATKSTTNTAEKIGNFQILDEAPALVKPSRGRKTPERIVMEKVDTGKTIVFGTADETDPAVTRKAVQRLRNIAGGLEGKEFQVGVTTGGEIVATRTA